MIGVLSKPADQISAEDLEELIASKVPEGEQIEFKESLSAEGGSPDPWMVGQDRIGKPAKKKLLAEVVAFANAFGGTLLLGVKESKKKPPVAASISPVPRCEELVDRLKLVFGHCVEPQLPRVEIFAIPIENDKGVVVIRTDRSRLAPHRVKPTLECTVRRSDRCEKMTMREIQDMTLNVSRGLERLEKRLAERSVRFEQEFKCLKDPSNAMGIRVTAVPVVDIIQIQRIFSGNSLVQRFLEPWHDIVRCNDKQISKLSRPDDPWVPILRGARSATHAEDINYKNRCIYRELHCDGVVEFGCVDCDSMNLPADGTSYLPFCVDWFVDIFANSIVQADRIRRESGFSSVEYVVDLEFIIKGRKAVGVSNPRTLYLKQDLILMLPDTVKFPRYLLNEFEGFPAIISRLERDVWNFLGRDFGESHFRIEGWSNQA